MINPPYTAMTSTAALGSPSFIMGLLPGDVLLFSRDSVFNKIINVKTWSRFSHVEVVASKPLPGVAMTAASRNGKGVDLYTPEWDGCALALRPRYPFNADLANKWLSTVRGQEYDWLGLLNFTYARFVGDSNGKMFCSEFAARYLRKGGLNDDGDGLWDCFPEQDADTISPRDFSCTPNLRVIWRSPDEWKRYEAQKGNW